MAIHGVGNNDISLKVVQDNKIREVVVKDTITITRGINEPSKLTCSILRDPNFTAEVGSVVAFTLDNMHNQFYGYIVSTTKCKEWCDIEAYDQLYYMNRNKMRYTYENKTATEVVDYIVRRRQYGYLDPPGYEDTEYKIPSRIEENVSDLTIITTALDLTQENTGKRFYIWDDYGVIQLNSEWWLAGEPLIIISMGYIEDYSYHESLDDKYTAVRVERTIEDGKQEGSKKEDEAKAADEDKEDDKKKEAEKQVETHVARDQTLLERYGYLELVEQAEEKENLKNKAEELLKENIPPSHELSLTGVQGDITVRGGTPILVDFFTQDRKEHIRGWFRTTSVTHTFQNRTHRMDIECELIEMLDDWTKSSEPYYYPVEVPSTLPDPQTYPYLEEERRGIPVHGAAPPIALPPSKDK